MLWPYPWASRSDERELGRRGVVGRDEGLGREEDRAPSMLRVIEKSLERVERNEISKISGDNWGVQCKVDSVVRMIR